MGQGKGARRDAIKHSRARHLPGYVEAIGSDDSLSLIDPAQIPGWDPGWNLDDAASFDWFLDLTRDLDDGSSQGVSWDSVSDTQRRLPPRQHPRPQRLAAASR